jgi:hypothetical protein
MGLSSPQLTSDSIDLDELRSRLKRMTDMELVAYAKPEAGVVAEIGPGFMSFKSNQT